MFEFRSLLVGFILCVTAVAGSTQQEDITVDTKTTDKDIQKWLKSNDPRLVAWGAYYARQNADDAAIAPMIQLVENWIPPKQDQGTLERPRIDAMSEVLDALIVRKETVFPEGLSAIAPTFPRQAAILASRLPNAEATPLLLTWYDRRNSKEGAAIPRIAAMILSKAPPPGFAASVLTESDEEFEVMVENEQDIGFGHGFGFGNTCGDGFGISPPHGWPPLFDYSLEENAPRPHDSVLVKAGGDQITYRRINLSEGSGSCFYPRPLLADTRHHLLAEMLKITEKKMPWQVQQNTWIFWKSREQFTSELKGLVAAEETKFHATAESLYAKSFLTRSEADSVRPRLAVTVIDARKQTSPPLPQLEFSDPRTTITYKKH
jgi:hypothetical protein